MDKVTSPVSGKTWKFDLDISNNKADHVSFYNFLFPYGSTSTEGSLNGDKLTASFDSYTVNEAIKSAKFSVVKNSPSPPVQARVLLRPSKAKS